MSRPARHHPRLTAFVLLASCSLMCFGIVAGAAAQTDWPMAGHDPEHTGTVGGPEAPYRVVWSEPVAGWPVSGAAVTDRAIIVMTREGIAALSPGDGTVQWEEARTLGPAGVPAVAGNLVLYAASNGPSGQLVARDVRDGTLVWQTVLGSAALGGPTVVDDIAYVGTLDGEVTALDVETGTVRWTFETVGAVRGAPAVADGILVAAAYEATSGNTTVYALDAEVGSEDGPDWQFAPGAVGPPSGVSIADRRAFVAVSDGNIRSLALGSGSEVWTAPSRDGFGPRQTPAVGDAFVLVDRAHVYALDPATGKERWVFQVADLAATAAGGFNTLLASAPAVSGSSVLIGSGDGTLSAIDVDSGHREWHRDLGDGAVGPIAASGDRVYAVTLGEEGRVVALEHDADGKLLAEVSPTVLFVGRALLNFGAAAAAVGAAILLLFRLVLRPRRTVAA